MLLCLLLQNERLQAIYFFDGVPRAGKRNSVSEGITVESTAAAVSS